jgi:glycosyltransferase involved in cell wall biosynthesis
LRIGAILPHLLVFGGVRRYIELGNAFSARGHEFVLFTPEGGMPEWLAFSGSASKISWLSRARLDVAICGSPELIPELDRAEARLKVFYLQLESVKGEAAIVRSGRYRIMVNSSSLRKRVRRSYGIEPIDGIGGVNPSLFHPLPRSGSGGGFKVLCYGRISRPRKGTRFVVNAARWMHRHGYEVELHLFDTINPGERDPRIGFDAGLPFRFHLGLAQDRMAEMYGSADVFVSAEHRAGWCNTAAEAASCGLAIVCTRSGTEDFALHEKSALVVSRRNALAIRRALVRLYRDRDLAARLGAEARKIIGEFTWDRVCARMERAFSELLADGGVE